MEYTDIIPGVYRFRNSAGEERERTVISANERKVVFQCLENNTPMEISTNGFIRAYKLYGVKER